MLGNSKTMHFGILFNRHSSICWYVWSRSFTVEFGQQGKVAYLYLTQIESCSKMILGPVCHEQHYTTNTDSSGNLGLQLRLFVIIVMKKGFVAKTCQRLLNYWHITIYKTPYPIYTCTIINEFAPLVSNQPSAPKKTVTYFSYTPAPKYSLTSIHWSTKSY